jgi:hypothetical protein
MFGKAEDVVYYNREFHFLVAEDFGASIFCWPIFSQQGVLEAVNKGLCLSSHISTAPTSSTPCSVSQGFPRGTAMVVKLPTGDKEEKHTIKNCLLV